MDAPTPPGRGTDHIAAHDILERYRFPNEPDAETRADELFAQTELNIALGHAHQKGSGQDSTWIPIGQFVWKNDGLKNR